MLNVFCTHTKKKDTFVMMSLLLRGARTVPNSLLFTLPEHQIQQRSVAQASKFDPVVTV